MADQQQQQPKPRRVLRRKEVSERIGLGPSSVKDKYNPKSPRFDPSFPQPIPLGDGANSPVGFDEEELNRWIESRKAKRRCEPAPA